MRDFGDRAFMGDNRVRTVTVEEKNLRNQIVAQNRLLEDDTFMWI